MSNIELVPQHMNLAILMGERGQDIIHLVRGQSKHASLETSQIGKEFARNGPAEGTRQRGAYRSHRGPSIPRQLARPGWKRATPASALVWLGGYLLTQRDQQQHQQRENEVYMRTVREEKKIETQRIKR